MTSKIIAENNMSRLQYVEPFAGGCGLALLLLFGGHVSDIHINDLDPAIWSFWDSVLNAPEQLVDLIEHVPLTISEWHEQKRVYLAADASNPLALGFATFYLNRTNRSGVIKGAGVIGGQQQGGKYTLGCRFNRADLSKRVLRIAKYKERIHLTNRDAVPFMKELDAALPKQAFFCIDPPYFSKGSSLYTNYYGEHEHNEVANAVLTLKNTWMVTYDQAEEISSLYAERRQFLFSINYSVQTKRVGSELLIASSSLRIPPSLAPTLRQFRPIPEADAGCFM